MSAVIPETYTEWFHCIAHECGIPLTRQFIDARLAVLGEIRHDETQRFVRHYGEAHRLRVVGWLRQARAAVHQNNERQP